MSDSAPSKPPSTFTPATLFFILACVVLAGAAYWFLETEKRIDPGREAAEASVAALEKRILALESGPRDDPDALNGRLAALEKQIETLHAAQSNATAPEAVTGLRRELDALRQQLTQRDPEQDSKARLLLAYDRLKDKIEGGEPYAHALRAAMIAGDETVNAALTPLSVWQQDGVPTLPSLQHGFTVAIERFLNREGREPEGLLDAVRANLGQLVRIRKVGSAHEGMDAQSVIARAEAAILAGEVHTAQDELSRLDSATAPYFADWNERATAYLAAQRQLAALEEAVMQALERPAPPLLPPVPGDYQDLPSWDSSG